MILEIVLATVSTLSLLSLSVYLFMISYSSGSILYRLHHTIESIYDRSIISRSKKLFRLVFLSLIAIGFFVCTYQGADAMLFWLPHEWSLGAMEYGVRVSLTVIFASIGGLSLMFFTAQACENKLYLDESRIMDAGLRKILQWSEFSSILEGLKGEFAEKINDLNKQPNMGLIPPTELPAYRMRRIYEELIWLAENQKAKLAAEENIKQEARIKHEANLTALVQNALNEEKIKQEDRVKHEAKHAEALKKQVEHANRVQDYRNAFGAAAHGRQVEIVRNLESVQEGAEFLIDNALATKCWQDLDRIANSFIRLADKDIEKGEKNATSINGFFKTCVGTSLISPLTVMASYSGDSRGGHTELYVEIDGRKESHLSALRFETSLDALVEGLYIAFELPTKGVYWHGLYDRDYSFLFTTDELIEALLPQSNTPPKGDDMCKLDRPCGIRVSKRGGVFTVSCLAAYPNGSIVDLSAHIDGGRLVAEAEHSVLKSSIQCFY